jgi:heme oxygenase
MTPFRLRTYLRLETRPLHETIDRAFSRFSLQDDRGLERFLTAQAGALRPLEAALEAGGDGGIERLMPDWPARRRAPLLDSLQAEVPRLRIDPFRTDAEMLGAAYVLEGSRLGARILLGHIVGRQSRMARLGIAFLSHDPGGPHWRAFLARLERYGADETRSESLSGAVQAFRLFERSASAIRAASEIPLERIAASSRRSSETLHNRRGSEPSCAAQQRAALDHPKPGAP